MGRFIEGEDRSQSLLLPESLDDYIGEDNPVRVIETFIDALDLGELGFDGMTPAVTGRPAYHPSTMLKIYLYGVIGYRRAMPTKSVSVIAIMSQCGCCIKVGKIVLVGAYLQSRWKTW